MNYQEWILANWSEGAPYQHATNRVKGAQAEVREIEQEIAMLERREIPLSCKRFFQAQNGPRPRDSFEFITKDRKHSLIGAKLRLQKAEEAFSACQPTVFNWRLSPKVRMTATDFDDWYDNSQELLLDMLIVLNWRTLDFDSNLMNFIQELADRGFQFELNIYNYGGSACSVTHADVPNVVSKGVEDTSWESVLCALLDFIGTNWMALYDYTHEPVDNESE